VKSKSVANPTLERLRIDTHLKKSATNQTKMLTISKANIALRY